MTEINSIAVKFFNLPPLQDGQQYKVSLNNTKGNYGRIFLQNGENFETFMTPARTDINWDLYKGDRIAVLGAQLGIAPPPPGYVGILYFEHDNTWRYERENFGGYKLLNVTPLPAPAPPQSHNLPPKKRPRTDEKDIKEICLENQKMLKSILVLLSDKEPNGLRDNVIHI